MTIMETHPPGSGLIQYQTVDKCRQEYDVIVVGGGHHGLTSAAFLAKSGKSVLVLEARDTVGGMCWTREMDNAPGFRVSPCALELLLLGASPSIVDQLELHKYGLKFVYPQILTTGLFPGGAYITFYKDRAKTEANLKHFSKRDALRYGELVDCITWALKAAMPYLMGPATRPRPGAVWEILKILLKGRKGVANGARILMSSMEAVLDEYFESEEVKIALGNYSLANFGLMSDPGSAAYLTILTGAHEFGVRRPLGGSGQFPRSLAACIVAHGGDIKVNAMVDKIKVQNGRAVGVALQSGEEISAKQVIAATDPVILGTKLLNRSDLPDSTHSQLQALKTTIPPINVFKADVVLRELPKFSGFGHDDIDIELLGALSMCQSFDSFNRSTRMCAMGDYEPGNIPMTNYIPSIVDRTLVPPGSRGETLYLYASNTPQELSDGRTWEQEADNFFKTCMEMFDIYAPGTSDLVEDVFLTPPTEFAKRYNNYNGNYSHVGMASPTQLGPWRPIPDFGSNKTPVDALWHAGTGSHPIPYLNGWAGRTVASEVLRAMKKGR